MTTPYTSVPVPLASAAVVPPAAAADGLAGATVLAGSASNSEISAISAASAASEIAHLLDPQSRARLTIYYLGALGPAYGISPLHAAYNAQEGQIANRLISYLGSVMGDVRSFSLDSPANRAPKIAWLRERART